MKIFLGSDHRGFVLKESLKLWLTDLKYEVSDLSSPVLDPNDDYPDSTAKVADEVTKNAGAYGIVICGSGVGVTIAANKTHGVRCCLGLNPDQVKNGREDEDLNILALASDYTDLDTAKLMVTSFLNTPFDSSERHVRRLQKINRYD